MSKRVVATLIICVALLTQLGASFWGAAAARDGMAPCHRFMTVAAAVSTPGQDDASGKPANTPATHDHASCSLCQLGFSVVSSDAPVFEARPVVFYSRISHAESETPAPRAIFNHSAPARAPPSLI